MTRASTAPSRQGGDEHAGEDRATTTPCSTRPAAALRPATVAAAAPSRGQERPMARTPRPGGSACRIGRAARPPRRPRAHRRRCRAAVRVRPGGAAGSGAAAVSRTSAVGARHRSPRPLVGRGHAARDRGRVSRLWDRASPGRPAARRCRRVAVSTSASTRGRTGGHARTLRRIAGDVLAHVVAPTGDSVVNGPHVDLVVGVLARRRAGPCAGSRRSAGRSSAAAAGVVGTEAQAALPVSSGPWSAAVPYAGRTSRPESSRTGRSRAGPPNSLGRVARRAVAATSRRSSVSLLVAHGSPASHLEQLGLLAAERGCRSARRARG